MSKAPESIEAYLEAARDPVRKILRKLQALVLKTVPKATAGMKWGAPVFFNQSGEPVIYLYGGKDHVNLGFINGIDLDDPQGLLEGAGKSGRHVKVFPDKRFPNKALVALMKQCE